MLFVHFGSCQNFVRISENNMLYEVAMYGKSDEPIASAFVEAESVYDAHSIAIRLIRKKYPDIDPQQYNQTVVTDMLFRSSTD